MAGWGAPPHAQSAPTTLETSNNKNNAGDSVTIPIHDDTFAVMLTDCLPGNGTRTCNSPDARVLIGGGGMNGLCIGYQVFSSPNRCRGGLLLDTLDGQEIQERGGAYPPQNVPASPDAFVLH